MQHLKISDYNRICRICLKIGSNLNKLIVITDDLREKIEITIAIEVNLVDELPHQMCTNCMKTVTKFLEFRESCAKRAEMLKLHYLINKDDESGKSDDEPLPLPLELVYNSNLSESEVHSVSKTSGGDTAEHATNKVRKSTRNRKLSKYLAAITKFTELKDDETDDDPFEKRETKDRNIVKCEICSAPVKSFLLQYHINEHNNSYPFSCSTCGKHFSSPYKLKRHKFSVHKYAQEIKCSECGIIVKGTQNLQRHKRGVHLKEYLSVCTICNIQFTTRESCKRHTMIHANLKPFECEICTAKFRTKSNLNTHFRIHTNEKPFKCEICDAHFAYNAALKKHVQEHVHDNVNCKILM